MPRPATKTHAILALAREAGGVVSPRDVAAHGLPADLLPFMARSGLLLRHERGLYALPDAEVSEHHAMAMLAKRVPHGVICLISALYFHDIGSQLPYETWMAIAPKAHAPRPGNAPFRIVRFSGEALTAGVETHMVEGVPVNVYGAAKTVVDCFKCRHKVGLDVALEALRDFLGKRLGTVDDLWRYATICRQTNVMRPYLEALT